jgi:hypothetical protein
VMVCAHQAQTYLFLGFERDQGVKPGHATHS